MIEDHNNAWRTSAPTAVASLGAFEGVASMRKGKTKRSGDRLGDLLVGQGLVTAGELRQVLAEQRETGRPLGELVFERGLASMPTLVKLLARQHQLELETERGFGGGLRAAIEKRHHAVRGRPVQPGTAGMSQKSNEGSAGEGES